MIDKVKKDIRNSIKEGKVQVLLEKLDQRIDKVQSSEEFKKMLKFYSQFHDYSYRNTMLIHMQCPEATYVAGYKQWQEKFNRHVKKGEQGIAILAPMTYTTTESEIEEIEIEGEVIEKEVEKELTKTYFRPVYVFDISQTEGEELPKVDTSLEDTKSELLEPLVGYAEAEDIDVQFKSLPSECEGFARVKNEIIINKEKNDTEKVSILIHELAHIELHQGEGVEEEVKYSEEIKEMEAEAVAFVVMDHFGLEIKSDNYLALYKENYDLQNSLKRIKNISNDIISITKSFNSWA